MGVAKLCPGWVVCGRAVDGQTGRRGQGEGVETEVRE